MRDRDKNTALHFGIMDKCKKLEKEYMKKQKEDSYSE